MKLRLIFICLALGVLLTATAFGQGNPTTRVYGTILSSDGEALPGVTVTFASPKLQGTRTVVTDGNGNYTSPPLPPGEYEITFQLEGFQTLTQKVRLLAAVNVTVNATMDTATVAEEIVVTGEATQTISETMTSAQTITQEDIQNLPITRTYRSQVLLAGGTHATGPRNAVTISGGQSWENLFLLNGVTLNENVRGQPFDLFIEDAIQETTTQTAGVSAEYGRFSGGVVNAITKSGGNQFSGSLRTTFDNDDWLGENELSPDRIDERNETFEATFGGPILKDRIWFFLAGRDREVSESDQTQILNIPYDTANEEQRLEGKLTAGLTQSHQLQISLFEIEEDQTNVAHGGLTDYAVVADDGSIDPVRSLPQEFQAYNYTGILTPDFFVEAQYSERQFTFEGSGGTDQSLTTGTPVFDLIQGVIYNESLFCDGTVIPDCRDEERDNENTLAKGSYFLSTANAGSHDIVFGWDDFTDIRAADNHQSPNDIMIWNFNTSIFTEDDVFPVFATDDVNFTSIEFLPILSPTQGSEMKTESLYVNDRWRLNDNWSINLGVRYDTLESLNALKDKVLDSDEFSPRLGVTYTPGPNSPWIINASAGRYVGVIPEGVGDQSPAGTPARFGYIYLGPPINTDPDAPLVDTPTALGTVFDWLFSEGVCPDVSLTNPFACDFLWAVDIPGATTQVSPGLTSGSADEFSIGFSRRFGGWADLRVDYINREFNNLFATRVDLSTGTGTDEQGNEFDQGLIVNNDSILEREYDGVNVLFNVRPMDRMRIGGNYTWSHARGTINNETGGSGPVTGDLAYPEYWEAEWKFKRGDLAIDQRHKLRAWAAYDVLAGAGQNLTVALIQSYFSGVPYSAADTINVGDFVENPGYLTPDLTQNYFFSGRGAFETDDITRTDLSVSWGWNFGRWEFFLQPVVINIFDEDGVIDVNTDVNVLEAFNPFTETPVEGVNWEKGENFGQPQDELDFQQVRTFTLSAGFRF